MRRNNFAGRSQRKACRLNRRTSRRHTLEQLEVRNLLTVFGVDTRYPVPASEILTPPRSDYRNFAAVGQIVTKYEGDDRDWICSGVLISPSVVLTNAHCVVQATSTLQPRYPNSISFFPGRYRDDSSPYGVATATTSQLRISPAYLQTLGSVDVYDDYALIMLKSDIGRFAGWMDIETYAPSFFNGRMLQSAGYPGDKRDRITGVHSMYVTAGPSESASTLGNYGTLNFAARDYTDRVYAHPYMNFDPKCANLNLIQTISCLDRTSGFDIMGGQSGSPIWYQDVAGVRQVTNRVVGLVTASNPEQNLGMRITPYVYNQIAGWIGRLTTFPQNVVYRADTGIDLPETPTFKPDLTDYDRYFNTQFNTLAKSTVQRGGEVNYSFRAYNAGTKDLPAGTLLRVYASLDDRLSDDDTEVSTTNLRALNRFGFVHHNGKIMTQNLHPGAYHLIWKLESDEQLSESDLDNNVGEFSDNFLVEAIPPVLEVSPNQIIVNELVPISYQVRAFDAYFSSNSKVNLNVSDLPSGATFSVTTNAAGVVVGTMSWIPSEQQDGTYKVVFDADLDGIAGSKIQATLTIDVREVNTAPTIESITPRVITADDAVEVLITVMDPDGPADAQLATVFHDDLPSGANFDPGLRRFRWSPSSKDVGSYSISFWAQDVAGLKSSKATLSLEVLELNLPPAIRLETVPFVENALGAIAGTLYISDENIGQTHSVDISDPRFELDGQVLRLRPGVSLDFESEPVVSISITVVDSGSPPLSSSASYQLQVLNQIDPPQIRVEFEDSLVENVTGIAIGWLSVDYERGVDKLTFSVELNGSRVEFLYQEGHIRLNHDYHLVGENARFDVAVTDTESLQQFNFVFSTTVKSNPTPWKNSKLLYDVNDDSNVSPLDALLIINELNTHGSSSLPKSRPIDKKLFLDSNGDAHVSPLDALLVINELNRRTTEAEGEYVLFSSFASDTRPLLPTSFRFNPAALDTIYADIDSTLFGSLSEKLRKSRNYDRS